jgi:YidC/Oxa1 family membrane protein insertase
MRQAPFLGYLTDLSSPDPYFILPVFLGIVNFVQFKLNPQPADPVQAKVMMLMPLLMTGMMVLFPAGLALYWVTNTLLSIAQQWHINRVVAAASAKQKS